MDEKRFAVLIDADNNSRDYIKAVVDEITNEGIITYKRMYGDWTSPQLQSYKSTLLDFSITPIQQYSYTSGKNATDSAMIIDAMDILYSGNVDGFCLVSSDSDFTRLAARLREAGMIVIGMGRQQTPKAFVSACNKFKFVDLISNDMAAPAGRSTKAARKKTDMQKPEKEEADSKTSLRVIKRAIVKMIEEASGEDGWMQLSVIGTMLQNKFSDFDPRNYGFKKMVDLFRNLGFEIRNYQDPNNKKNPNGYTVFVREKE